MFFIKKKKNDFSRPMHTTPYFVLAKAVFLIKLANNHILLKHLGSLSPSNGNKFLGSCVYFSAVGFVVAKEVVAICLWSEITVTSDNGFDVRPDAINAENAWAS